MAAIFFDLETSDTEPLGQILNYSFILVDDELEPIDECSGLIKISKLQLPRPQAILANKVDVLEHQQQAKDTEPKALSKIHQFFTDSISRLKKPIALIGFNSSKFDLPFLRTSFIRNGLNPFAWKGNLIDRDLFLAVRALYCRHSDFPAPEAVKDNGERRLSLRLEALGAAFGLLDGPQTHFSRDDVLLTIELARSLRELFDFQIERYLSYEAQKFERIKDPKTVLWCMEPQYSLSEAQRFTTIPYAFISATHSYALWVDLQRYQKGDGKRAIVGVSKSNGGLIVADSQLPAGDWGMLAQKAREEFSEVTVDTFFPETICDIEQHIWRLDFSERDALARSIADRDKKHLKSVDSQILYMRYFLSQYDWGSGNDAQMEKHLKAYALRRYGGQVILSKTVPSPNDKPRVHSTYTELRADLEKCREQADNTRDKKLLQSLADFYDSSDIVRVAGAELLEIPAKHSSSETKNTEALV